MKTHFTISPRILDHLGVSAYSSINKCLAELCSNCYDADAENIQIEMPENFNIANQITLKDDGNGMTPDDIRDKYLYIGFNRRNDSDVSEKKKRKVIGNKGIGKLAAFGIANTIIIKTVKNNILSTIELKKEYFDDFKNIEECEINVSTETTSEAHGTTLILKDLSEKMRPFEVPKLRAHLFKSLPNIPDFTIRVNRIPCSADDVEGIKIPIDHTFEGIGPIKGYYVIASVRQKQAGVIIRVRQRAVTEPSLFGLEKRSHFSFSAEKIVGEINADFLDPFINTSRDNFLEEAEEVEILKLYLHDFFKGVVDELEKEAEGKRTKKIIEVPAIQEKLQKLPLHIRTKARSVIEAVISKSKLASDEEINELVDWIIKYFDSNVLRELMNSIIHADSNDVQKLAELIKDWGLRQMNNVTEIIRDQINIIKKLEELVNSEKSLEIEVHKLIEGNLWLIREGLELWSTDKPLKTVLDNHFDNLYAKNKDERPDVICRSRDGGNEAIVLEFKRPKVRVTMDHVTQALKYEGILSKHRPSIKFETFVIGRTYDTDVLSIKDKLAAGHLYLWSFSEILQKTRMRFEKILEILNL
ncbi:MAG: ATP-binding protein [Bacteroidota bacterium]